MKKENLKEGKRLYGIGKIQYPARILGYLLAMFTFAVNQSYVGELDSVLSWSFIIFSLVHPHMIFYLYWRSYSNKKIEERALLFDAFYSGATAALMGFNFLPALVMVAYATAGTLIAKGPVHFFKGIGSAILGAGFTLLISGFSIDIQNHNEFGLILMVGVFMFGYTLLFSTAANMSIVQVMKQKKLIRKQKDEINAQHQIIEEKNLDITNSINYAKRLQEAILPEKDLIRSAFDDAFILYEPKDIVAGDFYWCYETDSAFYLAVADCTGHGVPGAMVSLVCSGALTRSVKEFGLEHSDLVLNKTRELVIETFASKGNTVKDGMDICLCKVEKISNKVEYSGANNSLYVCSNNMLEEIKPDKQPIGVFEHAKPFTKTEFTCSAGDLLFLFTDGYADQFGGSKGKKLKYKKFKEILADKQDQQPLAKKKAFLEREFHEWKGEFEQVDDVCVIGVRI